MQLLQCIVAVLDAPTEPDGGSFQYEVIRDGHICLKRLPTVNAFSLHGCSGDGTGRQGGG